MADKKSVSEKLSSDFSDLRIKNKDGRMKRSRQDSGDRPTKKMSRSSSLAKRQSASSVSDVSGDEKVKTVLSKKDKIIELPQSPAYGKAGMPAMLKVNCFRVHCKTEHINQYSVVFDPPLPDDSSIRKFTIINRHQDKLREAFGVYLFDSMQMWSLKKLTKGLKIDNDPEYMVTISYTKSVDLRYAPYEEFNQIIHIIFQKATQRSNLVKIGRNYYDKNTLNDEKFLLTRDRIRLFRGYSMNIEQTLDGLHLMVDISHRVISTDNVAQLIDSIEDMLSPQGGQFGGNRRGSDRRDNRGGDRGNYRGSSGTTSRESYGTSSGNDDRNRVNTDDLMKRAEEDILGRSVVTTYRMRNWTIHEIDWTQNIDSTFTCQKKTGEVSEISYRDYFMQNYRLKLTNTRYGLLVNLPKVRQGKPKRKGPDRFVLPPEACYMTGLSKKMKADFSLMKRIRDIVSLRPNQRYEGITKIVSQVSRALETNSSSEDKTESSDETSENLRIKIEPKGIQFEGRVIRDTFVKINSEGNHMEVKCKDLMRHWARAHIVNPNPHTVERWVVFHEVRYRNQATALVSNLMRSASKYRMLKQPLDVLEVNANPRGKGVYNAWKEEVDRAIENIRGLQLIVVVIPSHFRSDDVYKAVKTATLLHPKRLIPTQCIKAQRFDNRNARSLRSVISSTLMQILTKRGNIPWVLNFATAKDTFNPFDRPTMICGIDVNHDNARNTSTAGICVSGDSRFSRYDTYVSTGEAGKECIQGAEKCMVKSLIGFHSDNGKLPEHVVVFRDGVSNSELTTILKTEVKSFRKSFKHKEVLKRAQKNYSPKLTFVVVQKRVSLRIFSKRLESGEPGTVVDNTIVSSRFWDFYMLTTKPPPGKTSRPTRYVVIYDDFGMSNDSLQNFTNKMCHCYYNFPGPIRVPAPCQIAHKVAFLYGSVISTQRKELLFTPKCKGKAYYL